MEQSPQSAPRPADATPAESQPSTPPEEPAAAGGQVRSTLQELEQAALEAGTRLEEAGRELSRKLDEKLSSSESGREVKEKAGRLWRRIQDAIK